jgi:hypothetical protein
MGFGQTGVVAVAVALGVLGGRVWAEEPSADEKAVIDLTNKERAAKGLKPLGFNAKLAEAARKHSANMAAKNTLAHELDGKGPAERVGQAGYKFGEIGENVAFGQKDAAAALDSWMHSAGHRANILNGRFTEIGVGIARDADGRPYYTQVFAAPLSAGGHPPMAGEPAAPMSTARFRLTNATDGPLAVNPSGGAKKIDLPAGATAEFTLYFLGDKPHIRLGEGNAQFTATVEDGGDYEVSPGPDGRLAIRARNEKPNPAR